MRVVSYETQPRERELIEIERLFLRNGLPMFIHDYDAAEDIYARASPVLVVVAAAEAVLLLTPGGAVPGRAGAWALAVGGAVLARVWWNRWHGRADWSLPRRVGLPWLAGFILGPALLRLLLGGPVDAALVLALVNAAFLAWVALLLGSGVVAAIIASLGGLIEELGASLTSTLRALPLLVVFALVLFSTTEFWQVFTTMPLPFVAAVVALFFLTYGALTVSAPVYQAWDVTPGAWTWSPPLLGHPLTLTESLTRVTVAISSFCALYYVTAMSTDPNYRADFLDRVAADVTDVFAARARYLHLRAGAAAPPSRPQ